MSVSCSHLKEKEGDTLVSRVAAPWKLQGPQEEGGAGLAGLSSPYLLWLCVTYLI